MPTVAPDAKRRTIAEAAEARWARDPHERRRQLALGHVRGLLVRHPDDLAVVLATAAEAVTASERHPEGNR